MPLTETEELELLFLLELEERDALRSSLVEFVEAAWPVVESDPFIPGWHITAMCLHLEAVTARLIRRLLINVPPRSSKSLITAVLWPAWVWASHPEARFIFASYSSALSIRDSVKCRDLLRSAWYQRTFSPPWELKADQDLKSRFHNTVGGFRMATSVGAMATGEGGDYVVGDDLHDVQEDLSETRAEIEGAVQFWQTVMPSRVTNPKETCHVVVGQRVAEDDISGVLLKQGDYEYLAIPMEYEDPGPGVPVSRTSLDWQDPRTTPGEPMCPARYDTPELASLKLSLDYRYYAQYQQRPQSDATVLFRRADWQRYDKMPDLDFFDLIIQSWDMAVKDEETSAYYAGHVWGKKAATVVLLDRIWARMDFPEGVAAVETMSTKWPKAYGKLIEDKGNGTPTMQVLRGRVFGLIPIDPQPLGNKRARAQAIAYIQRAHQAWVPSDTLAPWASEYIENMARLQWDDVDATSQAWSNLVMPSPALDTVMAEAHKKRAWEQKLRQALDRERRGMSRSHV